jgi:cytochrome c oxidase assembly protein subunit 15
MMTDVPLYNLSPLLQLLLLGALVAVLPLAWVLYKSRTARTAQRLRLLTWVTLFLTFDLVVFGAFTRLTDSGLGCPDWPGCYGYTSPVGAAVQIAVEQTAMPTGPVTVGKAWVEMIHRYLASTVGALILILTIWTWHARHRTQLSPWWPTVTLIWVLLQGAFGALTVTMKLFPVIVTLHLMGGIMLLVLLRIQSLHYACADAESQVIQVRLPSPLIGWWWASVTLLTLQIALGGWVSTNYAVLACTDFPTCQGAWWPHMDFEYGFALWRELGETHRGDALPFAALTAIHYTHRLMAYALLTVLGILAWLLWKQPGQRVTARWLLSLLMLQLLTGLSNVVLQWPLVAALAHTGGAAALAVILVTVPYPRRVELMSSINVAVSSAADMSASSLSSSRSELSA